MMKKAIFICLSMILIGARYQANCPVFGDNSVAKLKNLDILKNRNTAGITIDNSVTLQKILSPGNDETRFTSGQYVTIAGYVVLVKAGGPETCECHSKNPRDLDIHIELALQPNDNNRQAMVVEINRYTKADHPEFTVANLRKLIGRQVSVTGWMFFDLEHKQNAFTTNPTGTNIWRFTAWEVHPVLKLSPI